MNGTRTSFLVADKVIESPSKKFHRTRIEYIIRHYNDIHIIRKNIHTDRMSKYPRIPKTLFEFYATIPGVVDKLLTNGGEKWIFDIDTGKSVACFSTLKKL